MSFIKHFLGFTPKDSSKDKDDIKIQQKTSPSTSQGSEVSTPRSETTSTSKETTLTLVDYKIKLTEIFANIKDLNSKDILFKPQEEKDISFKPQKEKDVGLQKIKKNIDLRKKIIKNIKCEIVKNYLIDKTLECENIEFDTIIENNNFDELKTKIDEILDILYGKNNENLKVLIDLRTNLSNMITYLNKNLQDESEINMLRGKISNNISYLQKQPDEIKDAINNILSGLDQKIDKVAVQKYDDEVIGLFKTLKLKELDQILNKKISTKLGAENNQIFETEEISNKKDLIIDAIFDTIVEIYNLLNFVNNLVLNQKSDYLLSEIFNEIKKEFNKPPTENEYINKYNYKYSSGLDDYYYEDGEIKLKQFIGADLLLKAGKCCGDENNKLITFIYKTINNEEKELNFESDDFDFNLIQIKEQYEEDKDNENYKEEKVSLGKLLVAGEPPKKSRKPRRRLRKTRKNRKSRRHKLR